MESNRSAFEWVALAQVLSYIATIAMAVATIDMASTARCQLDTATVTRREVDTLYNDAIVQSVAISNTLDRVRNYEDMLAAGGGDRFAYLRATKIFRTKANSGRDEYLDRLWQVTQRFREDATNNSFIVHTAINVPPALLNTSDLPVSLESPNLSTRLNALGAIRAFRLNEYIPAVAETARRDESLHVVQLAVFILNETFADNMIFNVGPRFTFSIDDCVLNSSEFMDNFYKTWKVNKQKILSRKPREIRERPDGNLRMSYLHDPEKPDSK